MDGVKVTFDSRGMAVDAARQWKVVRSREPPCIYIDD